MKAQEKMKLSEAHALKKIMLARQARKTKWAPVWAVVKKFGVGKKVHPASITSHKRNWRRNKLRIKPYRIKKSHLG